jgi:AraC-like DNA-binding protein
LLSRNYPPSDALSPYVRRFYVFEADLPDGYVIEDFLLSENAFVRVLLKGDWHGQARPGAWDTAGQAVFFGANDRPLKVRVQGGFKVAGFSIRSSGWRSLFNESHRKYTSQMLPLSSVWGEIADTMLAGIEAAADDAGMVSSMEAAISAQLAEIGRYKADQSMMQLERFVLTDSTMHIEDAAAQLGMSVRQLERRCLFTFGVSPKAIFRRSRFLDMAAAMRGFSSPSEAELAALRFFDQSHLNREFRRFCEMTPGKFTKAVTPLQTAGLQLREQTKTFL